MYRDLVFGLKDRNFDPEGDLPRKIEVGLWEQVEWCDKVEK